VTVGVLVGAGGVGGPVALSLGAAGFELTIVDPSVIELADLHRQIQFIPADVGKAKASLLAAAVVARGGRARAEVARWNTDSADALTADTDLIVDASGDPATNFAVTDWAVAAGRPFVIASALGFGGDIFIGAPGTACFRCHFDETCRAERSSALGILGPVAGAIGGVTAALAIGLARGGRSHAGTLFAFDDLRISSEPRIVSPDPRPDCTSCARSPIPPLRERVRVARGQHA
jgi:adenylyltransferase/sulfurtransferase